MEYSRLKTVEVVNFMTLRHAVVSYNDSGGIINIKGYNDSGKSALLMAQAVCLLDAFGRKQAKFISHHEDYFRVVCAFDDGVRILRDKYINGQSLYEMYRGEELIYSSKEGNRLTKIDGVPRVISDYLGLCTTEFGCLNYQRKKDPLLLIETKGSQNYNMLHEALKITQISKANNMLNSHKNELASEVAKTESELQQRKLMYNECKDYSDSLLSAMERQEELAQENERRLDSLESIIESNNEKNKIVSYPSVKLVETKRFVSLNTISESVKDIEGLVSYPSIAEVGVERLKGISDLLQGIRSLSGMSLQPEVTRVGGEDRISMLQSLMGTYNDLTECVQSLSNTITVLKENAKKVAGYVEAAKAKGYAFVRCSNCGTYMNVKVGEGK